MGGYMSIEWLGLAKFAQPVLRGAKSLYDLAAGKPPRIDFEVGDVGAALRIFNPREQTIVVESIEARPAVLGFSFGDTVDELTETIIAQRHPGMSETARAVVPADKSVSASIVTFDPFQSSPANTVITVQVKWRSTTRGLFSRSSTTRKSSVRDIQDLQRAAEARQPRMWVV
jgi:hypothetical protein